MGKQLYSSSKLKQQRFVSTTRLIISAVKCVIFNFLKFKFMKSLFKIQPARALITLVLLFIANIVWSQHVKPSTQEVDIPSDKMESICLEFFTNNADALTRIEIARFYTLKASELDGELSMKQTQINNQFNKDLSNLLIAKGYTIIEDNFSSSNIYTSYKLDIHTHYNNLVGNKREFIPTRYFSNLNSNSNKH